MCVSMHVCVCVFILKMCELWFGEYEALVSKAKASLEPSPKSGVKFPRVDVQRGGLGQKGSLDLLV